MNKKRLLIKTAQFAKKHNMGTKTIVVLFAVIILAGYAVGLVRRAAGFVLSPFRWIAGKAEKTAAGAVSAVKSFCRHHRIDILKTECTLAAAGILLLVLFDGNVLDNVWGDESVRVYAQENDADAGKVHNGEDRTDNRENEGKKKPEVEYNIDAEEKIPVDGSRPQYYIGLNRAMNTVTIYTYDENGSYTVPVKAMRCATGGEETPLGTFSLSDKFKFAPLNYNSYGQYCTRITGVILFHSSTYTALSKDTLDADDYNLLGESVSHGCVRLTTADAKWIYDNCTEGTVVNIYDDSSSAGPLGKPETIKVPEGTVWDPTDEAEDNPWNDKKPVISGAVDRELYENDEYDIMDGVTATDTCGNDITEDIETDGSVDMDMPGVYTVTYSVTDALGRKDVVTVNITVK